jgi:beta-lactamase regulating signal transducer with metallopeptidase domain
MAMGELVSGLNTAGTAFVALAGSLLIQSSVLIVLLAVLDLLLRRRVKAVVRHWIWLLVLVKLLLPPSLSLPTSLVSWVGSRLPKTALVFLTPEVVSSVAPASTSVTPRAQAVAGPVSEAAPLPTAPVQPMVLPTWQALVLLAWTVAVLLMGALLIQRVSFVHGLMTQSQEAPDSLRVLLEQCRRQMGLRSSVGIRLSGLSASPCVCGLRRPVILMPEQMLRQLRTPQLRSVLFHELAHVQRGDLWLSLVQTLLQIVYLYHLPLWWANARIRSIREQAVDETALAALGQEAEEYPRTLLCISKLAFGRPALSLRLLGVVESEKALTARIEHMVSRPFPKNVKLGLRGLVALVVVALVLLPMAHGTEEGPSGPSESVDRPQEESDENLTELIRTAVANHSGAGKKEMREITRRVTQSYTQILLLDQQIEEAAGKLKATPGPAETQRPLLQATKEFEQERLAEMENLGEVMGIVPWRPSTQQPVANLNAWVTILILKSHVFVLDTLKDWANYTATGRHTALLVMREERQTLDYLQKRLTDGKSLPMRIHVYYVPETSRAAEDLRQKIGALAREANAGLDTEVYLELATWMGVGIARFYEQEGKRRALPPERGQRPKEGLRLLDNALVDPYDLEQDFLRQTAIPDVVLERGLLRVGQGGRR